MHSLKWSTITLYCAHSLDMIFTEKKIQNRTSKTINHIFISVVKCLQKHELFPYTHVHVMLICVSVYSIINKERDHQLSYFFNQRVIINSHIKVEYNKQNMSR